MITPLISVIMSVYNCHLYLADAIDSILAQTFTDFEFIILDDGSTDESPSILRDYAGQDKRIRLILSSHKGQAKTSNMGVQMALGQFIARIDADDIALPQRFEKQVNFLHKYPECVCVSGDVLFIDSDGAPLSFSHQEIEHKRIKEELFNGRGLALVHSAAMFRRETMLRVGAYQGQYKKGEDLDLYLRLAEIGKLANLSDVLLKVRCHQGGITAIGGEKENNKIKEEIIKNAMQRCGMTPKSFKLPMFRQPRSVGEHHVMLAYMAINGGFISSACKHALKAIRFEPFSKKALKIVFLSMFLTIPGMKIAYRSYKTIKK